MKHTADPAPIETQMKNLFGLLLTGCGIVGLILYFLGLI